MNRSFHSIVLAMLAAGLTVARRRVAPQGQQALPGRARQLVGRAPDATAGLKLIVEPGDVGAIRTVLTSARHSLDMTMYELADPVAEADLAADAARGIDVRVVLDRNREQHANTPAYDYLSAHRVKVHWAPSSYDATHEKAVVVDAGYPGQASLIMSLNLTSRYYATTRDFAVVDHNPADVAAIASVFNADYAGDLSAPTPAGIGPRLEPGLRAGAARPDRLGPP